MLSLPPVTLQLGSSERARWAATTRSRDRHAKSAESPKLISYLAGAPKGTRITEAAARIADQVHDAV